MKSKVTTIRLSDFTVGQIDRLKRKMGINSVSKVVALAIDRLSQKEVPGG